MAWPAASSDVASATDSGSPGTTLATPAGTLSVTAGDLIFVPLSWEGDDTTITSVADTVNTYSEISFTGGHPGVSGSEPWGAAFWAVAATTTTLTVTGTWGASRSFKHITAVVFHPDAAGTISLDGTPIGNGEIDSSVDTGNITTNTQATNCGLAVAIYSYYGTDFSGTPQINGTNADATLNENGHRVWHLRYTTGFTGQATATLTGSNNHAEGVIGFKIVAGGGPAILPMLNPKTNTLLRY